MFAVPCPPQFWKRYQARALSDRTFPNRLRLKKALLRGWRGPRSDSRSPPTQKPHRWRLPSADAVRPPFRGRGSCSVACGVGCADWPGSDFGSTSGAGKL